MNCYTHPDRAAASFCRACGRALCTVCQRPAEGTVFCSEHLPVPTQSAYSGTYSGAYAPADPASSYAGANPYAQGQAPFGASPSAVAPIHTSPGLAFLLGFIPGVGAIYNGQYIKGLVHVVIFALLIGFLSSNENNGAGPAFGFLLAAYIFYMPFEAYHTAKRRQSGIPVEEWSSLSRGPLPASMTSGRTPIGPIILIGVGVLFLLDTMNLIEFRQIGRFWPVILIAIGASMLYSRMAPREAPVLYPPGSTVPPHVPSGMASPPSTPAAGSDFVETGRE